MLTIRRADERGHATRDWLESYHSFSFGDYYDPDHMGVSVLRVINEDYIQPDSGFPTHPHRNMEIVTYMLSGELAHRDSMGNGSTIGAGEVQRMSAGTGVRHSEVNPSLEKQAHLLQIWLLPKEQGIEPGYEQKYFSAEEKQGRLRLLVSEDGREGSITAHTDTSLYAALLEPGENISQCLNGDRMAYVHVIRGIVNINGQRLERGDAATLVDETHLTLNANENSEILLFDLPK
ncbi:Pirin [gamma proteobacterium IMCC2047]|nr:Pirin [gamma proteobacterium IMCC2047]